MNKTIEKIRSLRSIVPDADFASLSRSVILSSSRSSGAPKARKSFIYEFGVSLGVMATAVAVAVLLGGVRAPETMIMAANINAVEKEAASVTSDIDIALREVNFFDQSSKKTALALNEAAGNGPSHLNESVLSSEINKLEIPAESDKNITDLLDQAIF